MNLSKSEIINIVRKFFPRLDKGDVEEFLSIAEYKKTKSKEQLLKSGRTDKIVFLILKGSARASSVNESGEEVNNYLRSEGGLVGDARVFGDEIQILDVESIGESHFLKFDVTKLEQLGFSNRKLMEFYLSFLKEIIVTLSHRVNTFVSMSAKERYEDLVRWNPKYLNSTFDKHLASFLGITPLTLYRIKREVTKPIK